MNGRKRALKTTWRQTWPIWLTFGLLFGFGALGVWVLLPSAQTPVEALRPNEDATVDIGEIQPNVSKLFSYPLEAGSPVEFFVERDTANNMTVAFASCRRCYRAGHFRQGGQIFCGRCNEPMVRAIAGQTPPAEKDCTQIPIPFDRSGGRVTIRADSVRATFVQWYGPTIFQNGGDTAEGRK
jgi:uncharacterized membrane protein